MQLKTEGLILRVTRFDESSRFVRILTPPGEVLELLARSVGKSRKRFAGGLEPLSLQQFEISKRRATYVAEQAEHVNDYMALRADLPRYYLASYASERALAAAPCQGLFHLMISLLDNLETTPPDLLAMKAAFDLKLLAASGLAPQIDHCVACGDALGSRPAALDPGGGGFDCPTHAGQALQSYSPGARALLMQLGTADFSQVPRLKMNPEQRLAVRRAVDHFLESHLGAVARSQKLLEAYL